ncbi:MAG: hypothetical protein NTW19_07595, partial [Planctomycetota bacterium]|nr:hypothetical protein [Planctomycetota bacterium]
ASALLAKAADASQAAGLQAAIAKQKDKATKLYLLDALAHATGTTPPPPPADVRPANSVMGTQNIAWLTGGGDPDSPYQAYYSLGGHGDITFTDSQRKSHDAGKAFFNRISPVGETGTIMVDPLAQDNFWLSLDGQMPAEALPYIDGLVYGEESMGMSPDAVWKDGWRLFCSETHIDPKRVAGLITNLNPYERRAWTAWGMRRAVEGFNRLYDYTKLRYGKLHPGIAVCTFLGEQALGGAGANVADFDWKFDVGGIYHYIGHTRKDAFSLVRRYKTIWPDRPVLWLSNGIGVYERTPIQHNHLGPTLPITDRTWRCYTDAVTAWMAGADTGWFSIWAFLPPHWVNRGMSSLEGPTILPEAIVAGNPALQRCIDFAFTGMEEETRVNNAMAKEEKKEIGLAPSAKEKGVHDLMEQIENGDAPDPAVVKIRAEKARMFTTFHIYRKFLFDCARLLQSLPRNNPKCDTLVVQPGLTVWDGAIGSPGSDLLNYYDFLLDINKAPRLELAKYRFIAVKDPGALTDETIAALTKWLRETPGVLYVHLNLSADNANQEATPECFDGKLKNDWPWEADLQVNAPTDPAAKPAKKAAGEGLELVAGPAGGKGLTVPGGVAARTFTLAGAGAKAIYTHDNAAVLALWRKPEFKGAVVFDGVDGGGKPYRDELRRIMNDLHTTTGVGVTIDGPIRQEMLVGEHFIAQTSAGAFEARATPGVDVITGEINPVVGTHKSAALVLKDFQGKFAAEINGVTVLCDKPIKKLDKIPNGIRLECAGLVQIAAAKSVEFKTETGDMPPTIADEKLNDWVLLKTDAGTCRLPSGGAKDGSTGMLTYVRCERPLLITIK